MAWCVPELLGPKVERTVSRQLCSAGVTSEISMAVSRAGLRRSGIAVGVRESGAQSSGVGYVPNDSLIRLRLGGVELIILLALGHWSRDTASPWRCFLVGSRLPGLSIPHSDLQKSPATSNNQIESLKLQPKYNNLACRLLQKSSLQNRQGDRLPEARYV